MLLKDKVAVITGGAGINGLGYATARLMAGQGARVVVLDLAQADPAGAAARIGGQQQHVVTGLERRIGIDGESAGVDVGQVAVLGS